jgi:multidrug resistance protein MdtO
MSGQTSSRNRVSRQNHGKWILLDRVAGAIHSIFVMPRELNAANSKELAVAPSKDVPLFILGAIRDPGNIAFSLKISLCATLCYILYHAIAWPWTSSSVITVMVTGLTTTVAIKQRLTLRLLGATIGGVILGLGRTCSCFLHGFDYVIRGCGGFGRLPCRLGLRRITV